MFTSCAFVRMFSTHDVNANGFLSPANKCQSLRNGNSIALQNTFQANTNVPQFTPIRINLKMNKIEFEFLFECHFFQQFFQATRKNPKLQFKSLHQGEKCIDLEINRTSVRKCVECGNTGEISKSINLKWNAIKLLAILASLYFTVSCRISSKVFCSNKVDSDRWKIDSVSAITISNHFTFIWHEHKFSIQFSFTFKFFWYFKMIQ